MSWHPSDLVNDTDLLAYERTVLQQFAVADWQAKRQKTLEDWLKPQMVSKGFLPERFRTRYVADVVLGSTSGTFADRTDAAANTSTDDINLASTLAAGTDYLAIGSTQQFRGVSVRMLDAVSTQSGVLTTELWCDEWKATTVTDGTQATVGRPFSRGGSIIWTTPGEWVLRSLNSSDPLYWVRFRLSAAPTSALLGQISVIRRSVFTAPATLRTLAMIFREAPVSNKSPWLEKANFYEAEAQKSLSRAWSMCGGEFDLTAPPDDVIDQTEADHTPEQAGSGIRWERA
jgi:hypothetical protein